MLNYKIEINAGDTYELSIVYKDSTGVVVDLTDYTGYLQLRKNYENINIEFDKSWTVGSEDGVLGLLKITLTEQETMLLANCFPTSYYYYGLKLTDPTGTNIKTIMNGSMEVLQGVL